MGVLYNVSIILPLLLIPSWALAMGLKLNIVFTANAHPECSSLVFDQSRITSPCCVPAGKTKHSTMATYTCNDLSIFFEYVCI